MLVVRDESVQYNQWITAPRGVKDVLMSEAVSRDHSEICWSKLQLLIIDWADQQCSQHLQSGSQGLFADIEKLYGKFEQYWNKHELKLFAVYPDARDSLNNEQRTLLTQCLFEILLDDLAGFHDPTEAKMVRPFDRQRIRSNAYELAHYLINLRQRMRPTDAITNQPRLTHMLKVYPKERSRPKRDRQFQNAIRDYLLGIRYKELASNDWEVIKEPHGREWLLEVWGMFLSQIGIEVVAPFQLKCFTTLLDSALLAQGHPKPVMITAGTGFGKTEAFLFPILFYATINLLRQKPRSYGPDAILVYPRIDLCNNQLERYLWYAHCLKSAVKNSPRTEEILGEPPDTIFRVALGHSGARPDDHPQPFKIDCPICKAANQDGLIMLRKEGWSLIPYCTEEANHDIRQYLAPDLKKSCGRFSIAITTVDTLHRRLMDVHGKETLWKKHDFLPRFIVLDEIHIYEGQAGSHVANLARRLRTYLKNIRSNNTKQPNPRPPIFVGASATVGNPEEVGGDIFGVSRTDMKDRVLTPKQTESEPLGREYIYLLKTPPIRETQGINNGRPTSRVVSEQASLLQGLMVFWHAMRKTLPLDGKPGKYRLLTFVDSIDSVWRIAKNLDDAETETPRHPPLYQFRIPRGCYPADTNLNGNDNCKKIRCNEMCESPTHQFFEKCRIYQQGECWWTMRTSPLEFLRPMRVVGRISGFTNAPNPEVRQDLDQWDCMIATSTLEVGFDHSELIATAQFKAPPNPASFQQRKGRGGRGVEDIPLTLMVLGNSPGDLFAFKNEQRYFDPTSEHLKIQFDARNQFVRNQHTLSAVYDFMSFQGITQSSPDIHKWCDLKSAKQYLNDYREDLNNWMIDLYSGDGLTREECIHLVSQCIQQIENAIVGLNQDIPGIHNSLELFRREKIPQEWRFQLQQKIKDQQNAGGNVNAMDEKTLDVLQAAERWEDKKYLHPPDYFNRLPIDNEGLPRDPSWVIPSTFIPDPIGGTITVEGTGGNSSLTVIEPKLQTLANFLPGGYKHRWFFNLWYSEWLPVPGRDDYADISNMTRGSERLGTLQECLQGRPIPTGLTGLDPAQIRLVNPRTIQVQSAQEHHYLTPDRTRIKNRNDGPGGVRLSREPSSAVQTLDLIVNHDEDQLEIHLNDNSFGVQEILFGKKDLLRLFHSNLITCYPSDIGNVPQSPLSMNLKFYDRENDIHTIPTVKLHTQGITLAGLLTSENVQQKIESVRIAKTYEEHYWRLVYRLLWREAFLNHNLPNFRITYSFDCIKILKVLRFLDFQARLNEKSPLKDLPYPDMCGLFAKSENVCDEFHFDLFSGANAIQSISAETCWSELKELVLVRASDELETEIAQSFAQSLAMAVCRDVAGKTNTNLDLIMTSTDVFQNNIEAPYILSACIYDNVQGGNGTISSYVDQIDRKISLEEICSEQKTCDMYNDEQAILELLNDVSFNADTLFSFVRSAGELQKRDLSEQAIFKVTRLISSPSIAAFYQGVAENYNQLKDLLQREPMEEELACYVKKRPIADPRGNQLFEKFKILSGGISELIPRISEIIPLCHGSCPDCLGDSRLSFEKGDRIIADRFLLGD